jgi:hypothetical protein
LDGVTLSLKRANRKFKRPFGAATRLDLWDNARMFGLLNMALADGYIGSWETKYHYNY